jgi:hypothetical protein
LTQAIDLSVSDAHDSPPNECRLRYPDDCSAQHGGCIVSAISAQTATFIDPLSSPTLRQEALKFVLHFIGKLPFNHGSFREDV